MMKNLAWPALLITLSLTGIIWLTQGLRFIDFIVNRGVSFGDFLLLTLLIIPSLLLVILPLALFVAVLFAINKMSNDSEIVVLKSCGLSRWQLCRPILYVGIIFTILGYIISLYLLPVSYRQFKDMQNYLRDNYTSMFLQEEVFNNPVKELTVFIRERDSYGILKGIVVHDNRDFSRPITIIAEQGRLAQTPAGPQFMLSNGTRQEVQDGRFSLLGFDSYTINLSKFAKEKRAREREAEERFIPDLLFGNFSHLHPKAQAKFRAQGHQRLSWPLYSISLSLLAMVFLLSGDFNRRGQRKKLVAAVITGVGVVLVDLTLSNMMVSYGWLFPGKYALVMGVAVLSCYLLLKKPRVHINPVPEEVLT
jgi:lipopolysaccharide export system permease protein